MPECFSKVDNDENRETLGKNVGSAFGGPAVTGSC